MLVVTVPAATTALTILATVKDNLGITDSSEDAYLGRMILRATETIVRYLKVVPAVDGTATLGKETITEIFDEAGCRDELFLSRRIGVAWPTTILSVSEDGVSLASSYYRVGMGNTLVRLSDDAVVANRRPMGWSKSAIISVSYRTGYLLPGDASRDLPYTIEEAAIALIKWARAARTRDQNIKNEKMLDGTYEYTLFDQNAASSSYDSGLPSDVVSMLAPYVNVIVA